MGTIKTTNIEPIADNGTVTLGSSGDQFTLATGAKSSFLYPAFEAYLSASFEISDATSTKIQFDTERFDTDSCYDNSTNYRFTPTVAGKYLVYSNARLDGRANSNINLLKYSFYKNGSAYTEAQAYFITNYIRQFTLSRTAVIDMNGSSDYLEIFAYMDIISTASGNPRITGGTTIESNFGAFRIGS